MVGDVEFKLTGAKEFERLLKELAPFLPVGSGNATMAAARLRRRRGRSRIVFAVVMLWSGVIGLALSARRPAWRRNIQCDEPEAFVDPCLRVGGARRRNADRDPVFFSGLQGTLDLRLDLRYAALARIAHISVQVRGTDERRSYPRDTQGFVEVIDGVLDSICGTNSNSPCGSSGHRSASSTYSTRLSPQTAGGRPTPRTPRGVGAKSALNGG
jgi:hypothetical protein